MTTSALVRPAVAVRGANKGCRLGKACLRFVPSLAPSGNFGGPHIVHLPYHSCFTIPSDLVSLVHLGLRPHPLLASSHLVHWCHAGTRLFVSLDACMQHVVSSIKLCQANMCVWPLPNCKRENCCILQGLQYWQGQKPCTRICLAFVGSSVKKNPSRKAETETAKAAKALQRLRKPQHFRPRQ